jgi:hypothetical protein
MRMDSSKGLLQESGDAPAVYNDYLKNRRVRPALSTVWTTVLETVAAQHLDDVRVLHLHRPGQRLGPCFCVRLKYSRAAPDQQLNSLLASPSARSTQRRRLQQFIAQVQPGAVIQ